MSSKLSSQEKALFRSALSDMHWKSPSRMLLFVKSRKRLIFLVEDIPALRGSKPVPKELQSMVGPLKHFEIRLDIG